jgi:hypothetical protein
MSWSVVLAPRVPLSNVRDGYSIETYLTRRHCLTSRSLSDFSNFSARPSRVNHIGHVRLQRQIG